MHIHIHTHSHMCALRAMSGSSSDSEDEVMGVWERAGGVHVSVYVDFYRCRFVELVMSAHTHTHTHTHESESTVRSLRAPKHTYTG